LTGLVSVRQNLHNTTSKACRHPRGYPPPNLVSFVAPSTGPRPHRHERWDREARPPTMDARKARPVPVWKDNEDMQDTFSQDTFSLAFDIAQVRPPAWTSCLPRPHHLAPIHSQATTHTSCLRGACRVRVCLPCATAPPPTPHPAPRASRTTSSACFFPLSFPS
jgi:hypothetical protein